MSDNASFPIAALVGRFYGLVRADKDLGPVFNSIVHDWDEHLQRLTEFWSSMVLGSGQYKGNPLAMHLLHADRLEPFMFQRWLELWAIATRELLPEEIAVDLQNRARRIGDRFMRALGQFSDQADEQTDARRPYRVGSEMTHLDLPPGLLAARANKPGIWAIVEVLEGRILLHAQDDDGPIELSPRHPGLILPERLHRFEQTGPVRLRMDLYDHHPEEVQTRSKDATNA